MTLTRNLVRDLLPLYASGEASAETRQVVEQWLATDPVLTAELAALREDQPTPSAKQHRLLETERTVIDQTRHLLRRRAWWLSVAILFTALVLLSLYYRYAGMHFPLQRFAVLEYGSVIATIVFWVLFIRATRRLRVTGL